MTVGGSQKDTWKGDWHAMAWSTESNRRPRTRIIINAVMLTFLIFYWPFVSCLRPIVCYSRCVKTGKSAPDFTSKKNRARRTNS